MIDRQPGGHAATALAALLILLTAACGGDDESVTPSQDTLADTGSDTRADTTVTPDSLTPGDSVDVVDPNPPDFLQPCGDNSDCDSGWCVPSPQGLQCTKGCGRGCPEGWICGLVANQTTDSATVCLDHSVTLCHPCSDDQDCNQWTPESNNLCISYGAAGSFCGISCDPGGEPCPPDYRCATGPQGGEPQCIAESDTCECNQLAMDLQLDTVCHNENTQGSCPGLRVCGPDGLGECDAPTPVEETCNGADDDCDGQVDEDLPSAGPCEIDNALGTCPGELFCVGGEISCLGVAAADELCDGLDQDCDGVIDEGFSDFDDDGVADCVDPDDDGDGTIDDLDCQPFNPLVSRTGVESCNDVDDDCDGLTDEQDAAGCMPYYQDVDGDGFGSDDVASRCLCEPDASTSFDVQEAGDCRDLLPEVHPQAEERCNGLDDNCDTVVDEGVQAPCGGCVNICLLETGVGGEDAFAPTPSNSSGVAVTSGGALTLLAGQTDGHYRIVRAGWPLDQTMWQTIFMDSETPGEGVSTVTLRYRTAADPATLSSSSWSEDIGPFPPAVGPTTIDTIGGAIELEVRLHTDDAAVVPLVHTLTLLSNSL